MSVRSIKLDILTYKNTIYPILNINAYIYFEKIYTHCSEVSTKHEWLQMFTTNP